MSACPKRSRLILCFLRSAPPSSKSRAAMFPPTEQSPRRREFLAVRGWLSAHWASRTGFPGIAWWLPAAGSQSQAKEALISAFDWKWKALNSAAEKCEWRNLNISFHGRKRQSRKQRGKRNRQEEYKKEPRINAKHANHNFFFVFIRKIRGYFFIHLRPSAETCGDGQCSYAAAAGDIDLCAAWLMNFFITLAHITFLRKALSFTVRP
jgi:hypothetical protein